VSPPCPAFFTQVEGLDTAAVVSLAHSWKGG